MKTLLANHFAQFSSSSISESTDVYAYQNIKFQGVFKAGLISVNLSKLYCNNGNNNDSLKLPLCFVLFPDRGRAWWLLTGWLARKVLTKSYLTHHWTVVNWPCLKHWMFIMPAKLWTLIENQPSTKAFFARLGLDSTWSECLTEKPLEMRDTCTSIADKMILGKEISKSALVLWSFYNVYDIA